VRAQVRRPAVMDFLRLPWSAVITGQAAAEAGTAQTDSNRPTRIRRAPRAYGAAAVPATPLSITRMSITPMSITIITADLTRLAVDAIVNAANTSLLGGGGVDGAIHRGAGPKLLAACRALPEVAPGVRCPAGEARLTPGFDLPARYVIHTVGPVWHGGGHGEPDLLAACYRNSVRLAREHGLRALAFPAISCGVYGYPPARAAAVAHATLSTLLDDKVPCEIQLCCRDEAMSVIWRAAFSAA
jgi:O-acetyl-ADP-ribose deacetylase